MSADYYFEFLGSVWNYLPDKDRQRFAELWKGYEQFVGAIYQKVVENNLNIAVEDLQPWTTERWLPYIFDSTNFVSRAATIKSNQDLSAGIDLSVKKFLKLRLDGSQVLTVNVQGNNPASTKIEEIVASINQAAGFKFAKTVTNNSLLQITSATSGAASSIEVLQTSDPEQNACEYILGVDIDSLPAIYPKFRYPYTIPYSNVASIPELRSKIRDDDLETIVTLTEGVDYILESGNALSFKSVPPASLWAVRTQVDDETPWYNFGFLTDIYQKNSERYVGVIQGLWFAFWNGPTPNNLLKSLYLLFGLPTAQENGIVTALTASEITTLGDNGVTRKVTIPPGLTSLVKVGQRITRFDPLVSGIKIFDKINYPGFVDKELGRVGIQRFLTESASRGEGDTDETKALKMLEEYLFLPQIAVEAFIYPDINIANVKVFLDALRPINKTYIFQVVVESLIDDVGLKEALSMCLEIDFTSNLDSNETSPQPASILDDYEINDYPGLNLDPHGILFEERLEVEVRSHSTLIDSFAI